jgi:hypothetical protein
MRMVLRLMVFGFLLLLPVSASAADCDFDKVVGSCTGTVKILSSSGSSPSFSAEIRVSSSAPSCSKVEYYLDNTPNTTILKSANSADESLFGTKPISRGNITVHGCTAYASAGKPPAKQSANKKPKEEDPYECLHRHSVYQKKQQAKGLGWIGLMEFCPL